MAIVKLHKDLIAEKGVDITKLPESIQKKITKYDTLVQADEPDEDVIESLDETIYGAVEEYVEEQQKIKDEAEEAKKEEERKAAEALAEEEKKKNPPAAAPAASTADYPTAVKPLETKKEKGMFDRMMGRE
jgi:hypothetical protein